MSLSAFPCGEVSLYFELAAEGWRDFPWRGPVDIALNATVGDLWDHALRDVGFFETLSFGLLPSQ